MLCSDSHLLELPKSVLKERAQKVECDEWLSVICLFRIAEENKCQAYLIKLYCCRINAQDPECFADGGNLAREFVMISPASLAVFPSNSMHLFALKTEFLCGICKCLLIRLMEFHNVIVINRK